MLQRGLRAVGFVARTSGQPRHGSTNRAWPGLGLLACMTWSTEVEAGLSCEYQWRRWTGSSRGGTEVLGYELLGSTCTSSVGPDHSRFGNAQDGGGASGSGSGRVGNRGVKDAGSKEKACGNPIVAANGNKIEPETDFESSNEAGLHLRREYNKFWDGVGLFGRQWISTYDYKLSFGSPDVNACYPRPGGGTCGIGANTVIYAHRPDARTIKFVRNATDGVFYEDKASPIAKIVQQADGRFVLQGEDNDVETYSSAGYVAEVKSESGVGWTFGYNGTYPIRVTHTSGRYVDFVWTDGQLTSVRDPAGNYFGYAYHADYFGAGLHLLSASTRPGTPATAVAYHYEDNRFPGALTGKTIGGLRYSWFTYTLTGKGASTEHGGGRDRYSFSYLGTGTPNEQATDVTNPLGLTTSYTFISGREQASNQMASAHCPAAARYKTVDANGYDDLEQDFTGNVTDYDYNAKGQIVRMVEASGTPQARTTDYVWDANRNRIVSTTVVGLQRVEATYTADNRLASMTVVNLSSNGIANQALTTTYSYTKHANGMLASMTVDGPLAGTADTVVTQYNAYGDKLSVTNSLGHSVTYTQHDGLGRPGRIIGVNGDTVDLIRDGQGRVLTERRWVAGVAADTTYAYNAQGLIVSVTAPDGVATYHEYDTAHRLTRTWRTANGTVAGGASKEDQLYTYDLMGNITRVDSRKLVGHYETQCKRWMTIEGTPECVEEEQVWVEVPTITRTTLVDYDELGRVRARRGNNGQNLRYTYDANGNLKTVTDSQNRVTTMAYDALDRLVSSTDPNASVTRFEYDLGDRVTKVTDPKGLHTTYVYDGLGLLWAQNSPDTGTTTFQYNPSGQLHNKTRADGSMLSYVYDTLGRLTWYGTTTEGRAFGYDSGVNGKGRLCVADYNGGTKHYAYTPQGQVSGTLDWTPTNADWTGYAYDTQGRLTGMSYPSGVTVGYGYSGGKLTLMNMTTATGVSHVVAGSINYSPFGGIDNWTYGNNLARTHAYDLDGRLTGLWAGTASGAVQGLSYGYNVDDEITSISNGVDPGQNQSYAYDALGRLTAQTMPQHQLTLTYDAVGNRATRTDNGTTINHAYDAGTHRLRNQSIGGTATRWFNANAVGNIDAWHGADGVYNNFTYNAFQRPAAHGRNGVTTQYQYNALDQRIGKSNAGLTARYVYAGQNQLLAENNNGVWTSHLWLGGQPVGLVKDNTVYWVTTDHLSRPEVVTDGNRQVVWRAANKAFERNVLSDGIGGYNVGYPGQYWDSESGLWHNGFRDYEPTLGRYMQSDPIGLAGGISTYGYVSGNPISSIDPLGLIDLNIPGVPISIHANPGPEATNFRPEHAPAHVHLGGNDGPRVDTQNFQPLSQKDAMKMTKEQKSMCSRLTQVQKELIRARQSAVFKYGKVMLKAMALPLIGADSFTVTCRQDPVACAQLIETIGVPSGYGR